MPQRIFSFRNNECMLQNTIETLNYVLVLLPGETSTERTVYVGVLRLGNFTFAMETQNTDAVSIAKTSKVKNGRIYSFYRE